jgi:MFS family permease
MTTVVGSQPKKGFLGWRMLGIAIIAGSLTGPGQTIGVSVFINSFIDDLGLTRDQVSFAYLIGTLLGATAMPTVGRLLDERGVRRGQLVIGALFGIALFNMSLVQNWLWLAIGFVFIRMFGQGSLSMISTVTVALWFDRLRGRAMGLLGIGVSAGIAVTPILLNSSINQFGWRRSWILAAVLVPLILLPLTWFALVDRPSAVGQEVDGGTGAGEIVRRSNGVWGLTRRQALREPGFWLIVTISSLTSMLITGLNFHQIDLLEQSGLTTDEAARMFGPQIAGSTIAGFAMGWILDRTNGRRLPAVAMGLLAISHLLASWLSRDAFVLAYALSLGVTAGSVRVITATLMPKWFGTAHIGSLQGVLQLTGVAASSLGPLVLSVAQGRLGGYGSATLVLATLPLAALVYASVFTPPARAASPKTSHV